MDKIYAYGAKLVYGYGGAGSLYGGNEAGLVDRIQGSSGGTATTASTARGATTRSSIETCTRLVNEANDAPGSEVHHRVYKMVGMKVLLGA